MKIAEDILLTKLAELLVVVINRVNLLELSAEEDDLIMSIYEIIYEEHQDRKFCKILQDNYISKYIAKCFDLEEKEVQND